MSGKVTEALFDLIHSLTKSEKRYFKLLSSRHTIGDENNYVRLFDFLDAQKEYNEAALFEHFKGEAFLNRFSITKKRLYDHVLTALDAYHRSNSIEAQIDHLLQASDILYEKSLYDQSRRVLTSALKLAKKHEKSELVLRVTRRQKRLLETKGYLDIQMNEMEAQVQATEEAIDSLRHLNQVWEVKSRLFNQLSQRGVARSEQESMAYTEICESLMNKGLPVNASVELQYLFHHTVSAYYYAVNNLESSLEHMRKNITLFVQDTKNEFIEANKKISVLTNAIYVADKLGYYNESIKMVAQLKRMANDLSTNEDLSIKLFSSISSIELSLFLRKGDFTSACRYAEQLEEKLDQLSDKVVPIRRAFLEFKIAVAYLGSNAYTKALHWVNRILNNSELDKTEDLMGFAQLLDLLIHIELHHDQLLPYSLKNTQRFFKTRNRLYDFEKVFLQFIGRLIKSEDVFESQQIWEELYHELASVSMDEYQRIALDYFDFKSWAEAKLKQKSFQSIVRENYNLTIKAAS